MRLQRRLAAHPTSFACHGDRQTKTGRNEMIAKRHGNRWRRVPHRPPVVKQVFRQSGTSSNQLAYARSAVKEHARCAALGSCRAASLTASSLRLLSLYGSWRPLQAMRRLPACHEFHREFLFACGVKYLSVQSGRIRRRMRLLSSHTPNSASLWDLL